MYFANNLWNCEWNHYYFFTYLEIDFNNFEVHALLSTLFMLMIKNVTELIINLQYREHCYFSLSMHKALQYNFWTCFCSEIITFLPFCRMCFIDCGVPDTTLLPPKVMLTQSNIHIKGWSVYFILYLCWDVIYNVVWS